MTIAALVVVLAQPATPTVADLSWMAGCWTIPSPTRQVTEFWLPPSGGTMIGVSRTVAKEKTVEYEYLLLRAGADAIEYVATPSRQAQAIFKATKITSSEAVFENPAHDFPTRITYRLAEGGLVATIDGNMNGKPRAIDYRFQRGDCSK